VTEPTAFDATFRRAFDREGPPGQPLTENERHPSRGHCGSLPSTIPASRSTTQTAETGLRADEEERAAGTDIVVVSKDDDDNGTTCGLLQSVGYLVGNHGASRAASPTTRHNPAISSCRSQERPVATLDGNRQRLTARWSVFFLSRQLPRAARMDTSGSW